MQRKHAALLVLFGWSAAALAQQRPQWSVDWSYAEAMAQSIGGEDYRPRRQSFTVHRALNERTGAFAGHTYRILDLPRLDGIAADTNGHVHRLGAGWRRNGERWQTKIGAALAVSSNALKHAGDLSFSDVQPDVAVEYALTPAQRIGLRADDRLGRTLVYPSVAWRLRPAPAHAIELGFPETSWRWQWTQSLGAFIEAGPDGGRWRVRDRALLRRTDVRVRAWAATLGLHWQPLEQLAVQARVGRHFATRLRYTLQDGSRAVVDVPDGNSVGVVLQMSL